METTTINILNARKMSLELIAEVGFPGTEEQYQEFLQDVKTCPTPQEGWYECLALRKYYRNFIDKRQAFGSRMCLEEALVHNFPFTGGDGLYQWSKDCGRIVHRHNLQTLAEENGFALEYREEYRGARLETVHYLVLNGKVVK